MGRGRGVVGGGRAGVRVVRHGPAERAAGRVHLPGGGLPAARVGGAEARGGGVVRTRARRRRALLLAAAVLRGVAHAHHGGARPPAPAHGDRVLTARTFITLQYYLCTLVISERLRLYDVPAVPSPARLEALYILC